MDKKILFLGLDAAMPDLIKKFVAEGSMPNTAKLMEQGVFSRLETVFPPLTAAAWTAIVSGAGSGTNGVPSLMVKHAGEELDHWHTSFDRNEVLCETMWDVAKRMGKKVALINWPVTFPMGAISEEDGCQLAGSLNPPFRYFYMPLWDVCSSACFSNKLLHCNQIPGRAVQVETRPAEGWIALPESTKPCLEFDITVPPAYVEGIPMHVVIYASRDKGYDRMLISETKDATKAITDIAMGDYGPWITRHFKARDYDRDGRFRFQILELSPDGKDFKLYQSSINMAEPYSVPASLTKEVEAVSPRMHASVPPRICAVCTIFAAYMGVALLGSHAVGSPLISLPPLCLTLYAMIRLARQDKGAAISTFACIGITWLGAIVGTTGVLSAQFAPVAGLYAGTFITVAHPHSACLWNDVESMSARLQIASAAMGLLLGRALSSLAWLSEVAARSIPNTSMETFANGNLTPSSAIATTVCLIGTVACIGSIVWCLRSSIQIDPDLPPARQDACSFLRRCGLTDAEAKILAEIANGLSGKEIARKLSFAPGTVNSARHRGYRKLRINSKEELIDLLNTQKPPRSDNPCA